MISNSNSKLKKTSKKHNAKIWAFDIPNYKSKTGKITCPFADTCIEICYADKGTYLFPVVQNKYEANFAESKKTGFLDKMQNELNSHKITHIRIHGSGDFYSPKYLNNWILLAINNPNIIFYCYTKSVKMVKDAEKPSNFIPTYSLGGKQDHLIDVDNDRHSRIFDTEEELLQAGYINASDDDLQAIGTHKKIGLIFH